MILNDGEIHRRCMFDKLVTPYNPTNVGPASIDLCLGDHFVEIVGDGIIDSREADSLEGSEMVADAIIVQPGATILATTEESLRLPDSLSAEVTGRSTVGRLFIQVHQTAGFIDPGFRGEVTLEIANTGRRPVKLYAGDRICQAIFMELKEPARRPYTVTGQYNNQSGATMGRNI